MFFFIKEIIYASLELEKRCFPNFLGNSCQIHQRNTLLHNENKHIEKTKKYLSCHWTGIQYGVCKKKDG